LREHEARAVKETKRARRVRVRRPVGATVAVPTDEQAPATMEIGCRIACAPPLAIVSSFSALSSSSNRAVSHSSRVPVVCVVIACLSFRFQFDRFFGTSRASREPAQIASGLAEI